MDVIALVARFALATVFLIAGLAKMADRAAVARAVSRYGLLSPQWSSRVTGWLPRFELTSALLLIVGVGTSVTAGALSVVLLIFTVAMVRVLLEGRTVECGCFGSPAAGRVTWFSVGRNLLLLTAAVTVALFPPPALTLFAVRAHGLTGHAEWASVAMGTAVVLTGLLAAEVLRASRAARALAPRAGAFR